MNARRKVDPRLVLFNFEGNMVMIAQLPRASVLTWSFWGDKNLNAAFDPHAQICQVIQGIKIIFYRAHGQYPTFW